MKKEGFPYVEGEGLHLSQEIKTPVLGEAFPAKERSHVYKVEAAPVEKRIYHTKEGVPIEVSSRAFLPVGSFMPKEASVSAEYKEGEGLTLHEGVKNPNFAEVGSSGEGFIMLPGVGVEAEGQTAADFGEAFARASRGTTYVITTRITKQIENSVYEEAAAIAEFLKEKGISRATVAGNSQGGDKAIDLVSILQKEEGVTVDGLALLSSVGLRDRSAEDLKKEFFVRDPLKTAREVFRNLRKKKGLDLAKRSQSLSSEVSGGIMGYILDVMKDEPSMNRLGVVFDRINADLRSAATKNPHLKEIAVPVAIISGTTDAVSDLGAIIASAAKTEAEQSGDVRTKYLQEEVFPASPAVKVFTPRKLGGHALSILRAQEVADIAVRALRKMQKSQISKEEKFDVAGV